jgi:hypothetical protein
MATLLYLKPVSKDWKDRILILFLMIEGEYLLSLINKEGMDSFV